MKFFTILSKQISSDYIIWWTFISYFSRFKNLITTSYGCRRFCVMSAAPREKSTEKWNLIRFQVKEWTEKQFFFWIFRFSLFSFDSRWDSMLNKITILFHLTMEWDNILRSSGRGLPGRAAELLSIVFHLTTLFYKHFFAVPRRVTNVRMADDLPQCARAKCIQFLRSATFFHSSWVLFDT